MSAISSTTERSFRGTPVSGGIAYGVVRVVGSRFEEPRFRVIPKDWTEMEVDSFLQAIEKTRLELQRLIARLDGDGDRSAREILEMHVMVLEDSTVNTCCGISPVINTTTICRTNPRYASRMT
jgi:phosphoenolpyruvate-protein kinase (PTS system EI component)